MEILGQIYKNKKLNNLMDGVGGVGWIHYWYNYLYFDSNSVYMFTSINKITKSAKFPIHEFDDSYTERNFHNMLDTYRRALYAKSNNNQIEFKLNIQTVNENGNFVETQRNFLITFFNCYNNLKLIAWDTINLNFSEIEEIYELINFQKE